MTRTTRSRRPEFRRLDHDSPARSVLRRNIGRVFGRRLALLWVLVCLAGCAQPTERSPAPELSWTEVHLPDASENVILGALVRCANRWYAAGALRDDAGATRPAVWSSADSRVWQPLPVAPISYYGHQQVFFSLACQDGGVAALGSKNGGAHGNPRISSWHLTGNGTLAEVSAPFELYGGPRAITVTAIAGRRTGWLITGNWVGPTEQPTAAVWLSADASGFVLHADALGLASSPQEVSFARGVVAGPSGWLVFGDFRPADSINRQPAVWASTDGLTWTRAALPVTHGDASVTALGVNGQRILAMGTRGGAPHAWSYDGSTWADAGGFPASNRPGAGLAKVGDVTLTARDGYAAIDNGSHWAVWRSADLHRWQTVSGPAQPPSGADNRLLLAGSDDLLVAAESLRTGSRLWVAARSG